MKWSENDALFKQELEEGYRWQLRVADYLKQQGLDVEVPALTFRKHISQAGQYSDLADIECRGKVIEVKSRKLRFTNPLNFPYDTILVDTVNGWESKDRKPDAYICISTITGGMIALPGISHAKWVKVPRFDHTRRIRDMFYECHRREWRTIIAFVDALKRIRAANDL